MANHGVAAIILFGLTGLFASQSMATSYISCDGCSPAQMDSAAVSNGVGRVLVGDIIHHRMQAFRVYRANRPRVLGLQKGMQNQMYADLDSVDAQESAAFMDYVEFHDSDPVGYRKHYDLRIVKPGESVGVPNAPAALTLNALIHSDAGARYHPESAPVPGGGTVSYPTPGTNVYDVINSGPKQNAFLSWVGSLTVFGISNQMNTAISAASVLHITDPDDMPTLSFTVTFEDGSHVGVYVDLKQAPAQILVNETSGVDSHGNNVPATPDAVAGSGKQFYDFTGAGNPTDHADMYQQITSLGSHVSASAWQYACVRVGGQVGANCAWVK